MVDVYRKIHFGFFRKPLLDVSEQGFTYQGKIYSLAEISDVRLTGGKGSPKLLGIKLSDGKSIIINSGALELNGKRYSNGLISGTNEAFEKLKVYFLSSC